MRGSSPRMTKGVADFALILRASWFGQALRAEPVSQPIRFARQHPLTPGVRPAYKRGGPRPPNGPRPICKDGRIFRMTIPPRPGVLPANPCFSSGPCAKRPGWSAAALVGRRSSAARTARSRARRGSHEVIDRSRALLGLPADYRLAIVPGVRYRRHRDGDVVALGRPRRRCAGLRELRGAVGHRHHQAVETAGRARARGRLRRAARSRPGGSRARHRLYLERHHVRRRRPRRRLDRVRPRGADDLRCDIGRLRLCAAVGQARCRHLLVAEGDGRRGAARHADPLPRAPSPGSKATRRRGRCRSCSG